MGGGFKLHPSAKSSAFGCGKVRDEQLREMKHADRLDVVGAILTSEMIAT